MIVAFQPGGSIRDARVVLKPDELIPARYNTNEAIVYREDAESGQWVLVKPKFTVLPPDSPLLSQIAMPKTEISSLTTAPDSGSVYEHQDIIRVDEEVKDDET